MRNLLPAPWFFLILILQVVIGILEFSKFTLARSVKSNIDEARIVGIDIIKDKFTQLSREKPKNIPPEMVLPDRDVPGINDAACQIPIINASL